MRFDERAHVYAQHAHVQRQMAQWLAEWLDAVMFVGDRVVEYGAGEGLFTQMLTGRLADITAVDLAPRMVQQGAQNAPDAQWRQGDAWAGVTLEPTVDVVVSSSVMQWCPDPVEILRDWRSRLASGARMLHGFYIDPTLMELRSLQGEESAPLNWLTAEQWRSAFIEAGWEIERIDHETKRVVYPNSLELLRSLHGVGAVRRGQMRGTRLRRLIRDYDQRFANEGGGVYANWTFCRVQAKS